MHLKQRVHLPMKLCDQEGIWKTQLKSVQSTLSHMQSAPERTNAVPAQLWLFLVKMTTSLHDLIDKACPSSPNM